METITLHFTPTQVDYSRADQALQGKNQRQAYGACLIYALLFAALLLALVFYQEPGGSFQTTVLLILTGIVFLGVVIGLPLKYRKHFRDNPQLTMPATWEISEQGVTITHALAQLHHHWRSFREARETAEYFFLIQAIDPKQYIFLNKKAFESAQAMDAFRAALQQKVGLIAEKSERLP